MYIKTKPEIVYPYHLSRLKDDFPGTSFPQPYERADLSDFGVFKVTPTPRPDYNPETQGLDESAVMLGGEWVQVWKVSEAAPEEIAQRKAALVPSAVTMRQARLALLGAGKLALVDQAISSMKEPQQSAARIEWEYSGEVQRHNGFVAALGPALGLTSEQIDALFIAAATL